MKKIISIEGNIGSGKSTIIEQLKNENCINLIFLPEPVDIWNEIKDCNGVTILEKYYSDNKRYSFSFQMMAYITRLSQLRKEIKNAPDNSIIITERCLYTDRNVFAKMLYDSGDIEDIEYTIYLKWFDEFTDFKMSGFIYIQTNPEICFDRIKIRNRKGEENVPLEYLRNCHKYHEEWINNVSNVVNVRVLNGNGSINLNSVLELIGSF
jgi:deoxyadenosine/deoxycytidine kinase